MIESEKSIDFAATSPLGGGKAGRVKTKRAKTAKKAEPVAWNTL